MVPVDEARRLAVTIVFSPRAGVVDSVALSMAAGATVADALRESGMQARHPDIDMAPLALGIWGALCRGNAALRDGDRVEVYRPLVVDAMEARRRRHQVQRKALRAQPRTKA